MDSSISMPNVNWKLHCQERKTILQALMQLIDKTESDIGRLAVFGRMSSSDFSWLKNE